MRAGIWLVALGLAVLPAATGPAAAGDATEVPGSAEAQGAAVSAATMPPGRHGGDAGAALLAPAENPRAPFLDIALEPWTGDLDGMVERGFLRVAIPVSLPTFYLDGATRRGPTFELVQEFGRHLADTLPAGAAPDIVVLPTNRERVLEMVASGQADLAAGLITVTEKRAARLDFSAPFRTDVAEVLVTGPEMAPARSFDDLAGLTIHARPSTSFCQSLAALNAQRMAAGETPLRILAAEEGLRTEDMLDLVAAGTFEAVVADSPFAEAFAAQAEGRIRIHDAVPLAEGRHYAWAHRPESPQLAAALADYMDSAAKGTLLGNVILNRYFDDETWIHGRHDDESRARLDELAMLFRRYGAIYDIDWIMLAALGYQESRLDQNVRSPRGAVGIMQVLPSTARDPAVGVEDYTSLEGNIRAGTRYLAYLRTRLESGAAPLPEPQRTLMSLAAYNAGPANLRRARARAETMGLDPALWFDHVELAMADTVGQEPVRYVRNIFKYYVSFRLDQAELLE